MRRRAGIPSWIAILALTACFPSLPDENRLDGLRVPAVQVEPPFAVVRDNSIPPITLTSLVIDPGNDSLDGLSYAWSFDLPEELEDAGIDALLPPAPHGPELTLDLSPLLFGLPDDTEPFTAVLPLRIRAESPDDHRETVKLIRFGIPESTDPNSRVPPEDNNPVIESVAVADRAFSAEDGELPGREAPLYVGAIDPDGAVITVVVADDGRAADMSVRLYYTAGCPNEPPPPDDGPFGPTPGGEGDPCDLDPIFGDAGQSFGTFQEDPTIRELYWRPLPEDDLESARLFLVLRDADGDMSWQELRPARPPG